VDIAAFVFWSGYLARTAILVVLSAVSVAWVARLGVLFHPALRPRATGLAPALKVAAIVGGSAVALVSAHAAVRPDSSVALREADDGLRQLDFWRVRQALEPVARWGSRDPDVLNKLALSDFHLGRYRECVDAFHAAQGFESETTARKLWFCALAHIELGERAEAERHLRAALPRATDAALRQAIAQALLELRPAPPSPRP
jgi:hypothetical protein